LKREYVAISFVALLLVGYLVVVMMLRNPTPTYPWYSPQEGLPHLPAPDMVPGESVNRTIIGNLSMGVTGFFSTMQPHVAPSTFDFTIDMSVNNTGYTPVTNFQVVKVTMFYENATPFYTFGVTPANNLTIPADSIWVQDYSNDRDMVSIPTDLFFTQFVFARVLVSFDIGHEIILTSPLTWLAHAVE
jgi:hypothetical protein